MAANLPRKQLYDLVGESHRNPDGSDRQKLLRHCRPGDAITLVREPLNPHDPNAILATLANTGQGLGYLGRNDAADLAQHVDAGTGVKAQIHELTGGLPDFPAFGCRICVVENSKSFRAAKLLGSEQTLYTMAKKRLTSHQSVPPRTAATKSVIATLLKKLFR